MNIKSSHTKTYVLLGVLTVLILLMVGLGGNSAFGPSKTVQAKNEKRPSLNRKTTLNFLELTLTEAAYNILKEHRDKALSVGVIDAQNKQYVSAIVTYNGKDYKADIRLKGDWTDHLLGDKWSFRVKLKGNKTIMGMKKFSIHHPKTRGYLNEWLYHKATKKEGLMGLRYDFVEGAMHVKRENGPGFISKNLGIYALEETFDKRMIENNQRKESVILKFSEQYWWDGIKERIEIGRPVGLKWDNFQGTSGSWKYPVTVFSESKVLADTVMNSYFQKGKNLIEGYKKGAIPIQDAFNVKQLALQNAVMNLMGAFHSTYIINLRFYYNPITSKLEPISFDGNSGMKNLEYHHFMFANEKQDTAYYKELIGALERVSQPEYLNNLMRENNQGKDFYLNALRSEFQGSGINIDNLRENQLILKKELARLQTKYGKETVVSIPNSEAIPLATKEVSQWKTVQLNAEVVTTKFKNRPVVHLSRASTTNSGYAITNEVSDVFSNACTTSIIVKKGAVGHFFGIRIQGVYPNRADAIFNLMDGTVKDYTTKGMFEDAKATIEPLGEDWYRCTLQTVPNTKTVKLIVGPTNETKTAYDWESATINKCDVYLAN